MTSLHFNADKPEVLFCVVSEVVILYRVISSVLKMKVLLFYMLMINILIELVCDNVYCKSLHHF